MLVLLSLLFGSIAIGVLAGKKCKAAFRKIGEKASLTVLLLLFSFGITLGGNNGIMTDILHLGLSALLISAGCVIGSVLVVWLAVRLLRRPAAERRQE